jgi:hypothetical protein
MQVVLFTDREFAQINAIRECIWKSDFGRTWKGSRFGFNGTLSTEHIRSALFVISNEQTSEYHY